MTYEEMKYATQPLPNGRIASLKGLRRVVHDLIGHAEVLNTRVKRVELQVAYPAMDLEEIHELQSRIDRQKERIQEQAQNEINLRGAVGDGNTQSGFEKKIEELTAQRDKLKEIQGSPSWVSRDALEKELRELRHKCHLTELEYGTRPWCAKVDCIVQPRPSVQYPDRAYLCMTSEAAKYLEGRQEASGLPSTPQVCFEANDANRKINMLIIAGFQVAGLPRP